MAIKHTGGKKTDNLTVRFEPKLRYLAEIAAKSQKRSLSAFVEWAVENILNDVEVKDRVNRFVKLSEVSNALWDVNEIERFIRLAIVLPDLLTFEEQKIWKIITSYPYCFSYYPDRDLFFDLDDVNFKNIIKHWDLLVSAAEQSKDAITELDTLEKNYSMPPARIKPPALGDLDDDIPF
ncbi:hypothetical protein LVJ82_10870 [Vitreoscilla massiliensis]|uniref:DUF1778 domain-containing protein n=1 Tax=Vitreoscilla massiliensis TaxID=1689272 RepID=A0ABY4DXX3_9NEIS|nr:hypothetical protein [Vitreoscilla massiliensis]UOO87995.1 hypothetical protein LVJ82_10870 [Vitreoscilla massiliensis]